MTIQNKYGLAVSEAQIGYGHIKRKKSCEDACFAGKLKNGFFIAVSDGHGGADYPRSGEGARLACDIAYELALKYDAKNVDDAAAIEGYARNVLALWQGKVRELAAASPVTEEELNAVSGHTRKQYVAGERLEKLYGCTLICALCFADKSAFVQIGDGDCFALRRTEVFFVPVDEDERCQFNVTSSLCDCDAEERLRVSIINEPLWGIFLCTDGVSNSFKSKEYLVKFFQRIILEFLGADDGRTDTSAEELRSFLAELSERGSGDDVSVALCILNKPEKSDKKPTETPPKPDEKEKSKWLNLLKKWWRALKTRFVR